MQPLATSVHVLLGADDVYMHDNVIPFPTGGPVEPISCYTYFAPAVVNEHSFLNCNVSGANEACGLLARG
jgi:hypothetical protein